MDRMMERTSAVMRAGSFIRRLPKGVVGDSRTLRYLRDPVLPALALLSISTVTVATLVLVVTAVAGLNAQIDSPAVADPWSIWCFGPPVPYEQDGQYPGDELPVELVEADDPWRDAQAREWGPDIPVARSTP